MIPVLSVIIPCYNHGSYIREALDSIALCKETSLYEVIIINDGSTEKDTIKVLYELEQEGYLIIHQANQGLGAARNNGISIARGRYILPVDSDNRIRPEYIYDGIKILDAYPEYAVVYGNAEYFGTKNGQWITGIFNLQKLMLENYIDACAVFRKSVWEKLNGYDTNMPVMGYEDWDLWLRFALDKQRFYYADKVLFDYRVLANSMSKSNNELAAQALNVYMNEKYKHFMGKKYIEEALIKNLKENRKMFLKLYLKTFYPGILKYLVKKKKVTDENIF